MIKVAASVYGADNVIFSDDAEAEIARIEKLGYGNLPVCIAKTQYSLSDDPKKLGRPSGFDINVKNVRLLAGAGFIVVLTGQIMTMPGLPKVPSAELIDVNPNGEIVNLF